MATIAGLHRYAIKSFAGEPLDAAELGPAGLEGDRRYTFLDSAANRAGKPLTGRQLSSLLTYRARADGDRVMVTTPVGQAFEATSEALREHLEAELGRPLGIREAPGSNFDDSPLLLLNLASVRQLGAALGRDLDPRRFRANIELEGMEPDAEYRWLGRRLRAGAALLEGVVMCERCVMITFDADTGASDPAILRQLTGTRQALMGIYCRVVEPGRVQVGDSVEPI